MKLCDLDEIKTLLKRHGFQFSKSMGQNFLIENWVPMETASASGARKGVGVLEIGPGIGTLTVELAQGASKVVAVELDKTLLPILDETLQDFDNIEIVQGDIMKLDIPSLCAEKFGDMPKIVCANLPYNITTPVLTALIEAKCFESITVMIQREVAKRICAKAGTSDYGAFSVFSQYHAECELLYDVPPSCFHPAPKVMSSVIHMKLRKEKPKEVGDPEAFFRVVKAAFAQRRKTLQNCLTSYYGSEFTKEELGEMIVSCGLDKNIRGERLDIPTFALLADKLTKPL